ncbi:chromosome segregation protein SMC [Pediococcus stilesii]|uniref:Chromosome partition protein Smc n=1 Tax=Pediococcus stilesii TaxID=331679 RepID=A0A5R9BXM2_9LACO|nr:chromosome segregation protein SMC [Pediococcus stilesii]TLQ04612.1 chromosome segregation protein SMC [Pediococcus stilesii]
MKLRTIEISGFKSFADKTKIDFKDGITGIVGPNGSGKSNIIEAVRWVMGETSAKSLRGGKMPDVIFSGTEKRKPLARASVTIIFDNSDHFLDSKFDEVMVTRRLFRNGESQYEINKQECRLRDVLNLFIDTGLGRESFSIISQGRVESIFNSKPEERRAIIEEAAGVLEYKQDKKRAEKELEKTSGYLERVNDLTVELEKQVQPLEQQAAVAKDYLEQKKRFDILDQTKLVRTIDGNSVIQAQLETERQQLKEQLSELTTRSATLSEQRSQIKETINAQTKQKDQTQMELVRLNRLEEQLKGEKDLQAERRKFAEQEKLRLEKEKNEIQTQIDKSTRERSELRERLTQLSKRIAEKNEALKLIRENDKEHQEQKLKQEIENLRADYVENLQSLTTLKNQYNFNLQDQQRDEQQRSKITLDIATLEQQLENHHATQKGCQAAFLELDAVIKQRATRIKELTIQQDQSRTDYEQQRQQWLDGSNVAHRVESKLEALTNLKNEHTGFYQGVRSVLKQKSKFKGIVGPVAEIIDVPEAYTVAIETALGNQVQNVVVETDQVAKEMIEFLKQNRQGRVTFLPKNALKLRQLTSAVQNELERLSGLVGVASDLIKTEPQNRIIGQYLLGTTLIIDTLENAVVASQKISRRNRIITLEGDVIGIGGTMTGGATRKNTTGVLQQDQEIKKLKSQFDTMQQQLEQKELQVQKTLSVGKDAQSKLQKITKEQQIDQQQLSELANQRALEEERIKELERRRKAIQFELSQIDDEENHSSNLQGKIAEIEAKVKEIKTATEKKQSTLATLTDDAGERQNQITNLNVELAQLKEQLSQQKQRLEDLEGVVGRSKQQLKDYEAQITNLHHDERLSDSNVNHYSLKEVQKQLLDSNHRSEKIQEKLQLSQVQQDQVTADYEIAQQNLNQVGSQLNDVERQQSLNQNRIEIAVDRLSEEYGQTIESVQKNVLTKITDEQLDRELKLLKRGLTELGTVNLGAIDEYERVSSRYNFLNEQRKDLMDSKQQLDQSIAEIDQEAGQRFKQTFDQVATEFAQVFVKMFGGGKAKLELTDPEHILTTGIEIKAQPPGKKLQRLSLLSGGEKSLTAITLLFAILQVKPVPFCILDEVEAAFDDANVDRFARYLKTFRDTTQFIIITHRKGTMMEADVLYGVTMQESGVSKMVSVSIDEAEQRELV